jgi:hypothetical protein
MDTETMTAEAVLCKRCRSTRIIKSGTRRGDQRYQCKDCGCVFLDNSAPLHGRVPIHLLVSILERFFSGMPLDFIRTCLETDGVPITITGLEKIIYRFARKAVSLTADIRPELRSPWILEGVSISADHPFCLLDILDSASGFILASDIIPDFAEREQEAIVQKALKTAGSAPERLILGPDLSWIFEDSQSSDSPPAVALSPENEACLRGYQAAAGIRTLLVSHRLNFDSLTNIRLICAAWRVNYNFLSEFKPVGLSVYNNWLDIVNAADPPDAL